MQVSNANSLTWLQSASAAASQSDPAGSTGGQDLLDASGAEGSSPSSLMASLQSPSQQFSAGGLSALISAQLDQSTQGASATDPSQSTATQSATSSSDATQAEPSSGAAHHHHHHGGAASDPSLTQASTASSTADTSASSSTSDAETEMAQLLTGM